MVRPTGKKPVAPLAQAVGPTEIFSPSGAAPVASHRFGRGLRKWATRSALVFTASLIGIGGLGYYGNKAAFDQPVKVQSYLEPGLLETAPSPRAPAPTVHNPKTLTVLSTPHLAPSIPQLQGLTLTTPESTSPGRNS